MSWNVNLIVPINIISCSRKNTTYTVTAKKAGTTSFTISVKDVHGSKTYIWNDGRIRRLRLPEVGVVTFPVYEGMSYAPYIFRKEEQAYVR